MLAELLLLLPFLSCLAAGLIALSAARAATPPRCHDRLLIDGVVRHELSSRRTAEAAYRNLCVLMPGARIELQRALPGGWQTTDVRVPVDIGIADSKESR